MSVRPGPATLELLWTDLDGREERLRDLVEEVLSTAPPPALPDAITATYFLALRTRSLAEVAVEIAYHATSGIRNPPPRSLLAECTGWSAGVVPFDQTGRIGLLHMAYPLKMLLHSDGHVTSVDILHTAAAAIIFDVYENQDARLVALTVPQRIIETFPGPAHGPEGVRRLTSLAPGEPAFGTILKPTAGITPDEVAALVSEIAGAELLVFVKEDENLYPDLAYSRLADRTRLAVAAIAQVRSTTSRPLLFAPHVTSSPTEMLDNVDLALEAGATALMLSETWAGGTVRMVREHTARMSAPPAIYGHNAGIGVKAKGIWREVIDFLARLDGIDFRQTAPVRSGAPFLRPYGAEWRASENALLRPVAPIRPTMVVRAGALDQGNICLNLQDVEERGMLDSVLFLAGSAINSVRDRRGRPSPRLGAAAMEEALEIHRSGALEDVPAAEHLRALMDLARGRRLDALLQVLPQRYPELS
jgi:ribulose-bisphosphate carboxylase large chain